MLPDAAALLSALRLPSTTTVEWEPLGPSEAGPARAFFSAEAESSRSVLVRPLASEGDHNHAAVLEALAAAAFPHAPRPLAFGDGWLAEEWVDGVTALALVPPAASPEAAIDALASLHSLDIREGLRWEQSPAEMFPPGEIPLHRLGFSADERRPALGPITAAQALLLDSPFGFVHGSTAANHILLAPGRATLVDFAAAGHGPQLFDVAAFLLTAGLEPGPRGELARRYISARSLDPGAVDLIDLFGILWGIGELLTLPHRHIRALGDDSRSHHLNTAATRIERGIRAPAGDHPLAHAIRSALWPQ